MATAFRREAKPLPFIHPDAMPDMYALKGVGTCMEPLFRDGSMLVFDKRLEPQQGDVVGLVFTREAAQHWRMPGMLKRLALPLPPASLPKDGIGLIVVEQINPPRRYAIPTTDVLAVHKCIGAGKPSGTGLVSFRLPSNKEA